MAYTFTATLSTVNGFTILRVPQDVSQALPSRGMVMVEGTFAGKTFQAPFEPDGAKGHYLLIDENISKHPQIGSDVKLEIEPSKSWPEPNIPNDVQNYLDSDATAHATWLDITAMARWDWLRWIGATKNPATRQRRIEVMGSKLNAAKRRPCCFNRTECTDPSVSKKGVLLETAAVSS